MLPIANQLIVKEDGSFVPWSDVIGCAAGAVIIVLGLFFWRYSYRLWRPFGKRVRLFGVTFPVFGAFVVALGLALYYVHWSDHYQRFRTFDDYQMASIFSRLRF
jgi:hypothetical protein